MHQRYRRGAWLLFCPVLLLIGCSAEQDQQRFIPSDATARQALEAALDAWKGGQQRPSKVSIGKVGVVMADVKWSAGETLCSYEIVSTDSGDGPRWFVVKLALSNGEKTTRYAVVGIDPIWIYSEADYKKLTGT